jgi:uncharacterized membrane protein
MNQAAPVTSRLPKEDPASTRTLLSWIADGVFLAAFALVLVKAYFVIPSLDRTGWPEAVLVLAATAASMIGLARQLPMQNVLLASFIIAGIGGAAHTINALTHVPFGPYLYTGAAGPRWFGVLPWPIPLIWIVAILSSRGVSRLILRPWQQTHRYGFWVIGFTVLLSLIFDLGLEMFAVKINHLWLREPLRFMPEWYGTPLTHLLAWIVVTLLILALATPSLIRKSPAQAPPDYQPLAVWMSLNTFFAVAAAAHQLWLASGLIAVVAAVAAVFAVRGARWGHL